MFILGKMVLPSECDSTLQIVVLLKRSCVNMGQLKTMDTAEAAGFRALDSQGPLELLRFCLHSRRLRLKTIIEACE